MIYVRFPPIADIGMSSHAGRMHEDDACTCDEHGVQPIAFVCKHIFEGRRGATNGFVSGLPEDADDLRNAGCEECHSFLQAHGGQCIDGSVEVPGGITIICAECYRVREADARRVGRRLIHNVGKSPLSTLSGHSLHPVPRPPLPSKAA